MAPVNTIGFLVNWTEEDLGLENYTDHEKEADICSTKMDKNLESFHMFGVIDIIRESLLMLRINFRLFLWISTILITPLSGIVLCQVLISDPIVNRVAWQIEAAANFHSFPMNTFCKIVYIKMIDNLVSGAICFPFFITLSLLAKAAVTHIVFCRYSGQRLLLPSTFLSCYKRLLSTYLWTSVTLLGSGTAFILLLVASTGLLHVFAFSADTEFVVSITFGITFSVVFAHLVIISNLANVISIAEDNHGTAAMERAVFLIKGRTEVGLLMLLFTMTSTALVEGLFQYRIIGRPEYHYSNGTLSLIWEAPLLIIMHSFVRLCDFITGAIFYFTCQSFRDQCDSFDMSHLLV
ncbi:hypothetical protein O6H91_12G037300 [Diphasiastrum complanatum]|uniref:Uncharacterized protein n=1 Tax=Diphasiastrum complanatum TaxID=34168 RepID=A0ACC2C0J0_DIPCM|nr:hypothetical protein O6H91_12G037300 [Diphasiastrum complanatum]